MGYETFMKFYPLTLEDLPDEVWEPIPDWQDYQVSNFGRVKSFKLDKQRILKPQLSKYGYLRIELNEPATWNGAQVPRIGNTPSIQV